MSGTGERIVSVKTLKLDMRALLKQIIEFDRVLPRLPSESPRCADLSSYCPRLTVIFAIGERYLVVQIHYTNDCPSTYEPPGFSETDDTILHAADARGWRNEKVRFGSVYTGFHS
jgi:hypothetical protein